jgi:hypothetical protein
MHHFLLVGLLESPILFATRERVMSNNNGPAEEYLMLNAHSS